MNQRYFVDETTLKPQLSMNSTLSVDGKRPEGMCPSVWGSVRELVEDLAAGKGNFFDGWMCNPMSAMFSCNDISKVWSCSLRNKKETEKNCFSPSTLSPFIFTPRNLCLSVLFEKGFQVDAEEVFQWQPFGADDEGCGYVAGIELLEQLKALGVLGAAAFYFDGD